VYQLKLISSAKLRKKAVRTFFWIELNFFEQLLSKELLDQTSCFAQITLEEISLKQSVPKRELFEQFTSFGKNCSKSSVHEWKLFDQISSFGKSCSKKFSSGKRAVQNDQLLTASVSNSSSVQN
jgi:hypothetical protein